LGRTVPFAFAGLVTLIAHEITNPLEAITNLHFMLSRRIREDIVARGYLESADSKL